MESNMFLSRKDLDMMIKIYNCQNKTRYSLRGDIGLEIEQKELDDEVVFYVQISQNIHIKNGDNEEIFNRPSSYHMEYKDGKIKYTSWRTADDFKDHNTLSIQKYHFTNFISTYVIPFVEKTINAAEAT